MAWVKANERLPIGRGRQNEFTIRGNTFKDMYGHSIIGPFVTTGFLNHDDTNALFYFEYGHGSYLTNDTIEWLDLGETFTIPIRAQQLTDELEAIINGWEKQKAECVNNYKEAVDDTISETVAATENMFLSMHIHEIRSVLTKFYNQAL